MTDQILQKIRTELRIRFAGDAGGHDYWHSIRVCRTAMSIAETEDCDREIVALAALLHDTDDIKLFSSDNYAEARKILRECGYDNDTEQKVIAAISTVSFRGTDSVVPDTIEGKIVQDADRLDAIGAIGIARAFAFGGNRNRAMYDPDILPVPDMDEETYRNSQSTTINHFHEKLLGLKDRMNTASAKRIAEQRDEFMRNYLKEFYDEWEGRK